MNVMARRTIFRIVALAGIIVGSVIPDVTYVPYLFGWAKVPSPILHSPTLVPILLFVGVTSFLGYCAIAILRRDSNVRISM